MQCVCVIMKSRILLGTHQHPIHGSVSRKMSEEATSMMIMMMMIDTDLCSVVVSRTRRGDREGLGTENTEHR